MVGLIGLGAVAAWQLGIVADTAPRLAQLFLILLATALIARLDPEMLGRYLALLLPVNRRGSDWRTTRENRPRSRSAELR
jgi:hypothetical protein